MINGYKPHLPTQVGSLGNNEKFYGFSGADFAGNAFSVATTFKSWSM